MVGSDHDLEYPMANLGLATTRELLKEIEARIKANWPGGLDYRTADKGPQNYIIKPNTITYEKVSADRPQDETTTHTFKE